MKLKPNQHARRQMRQMIVGGELDAPRALAHRDRMTGMGPYGSTSSQPGSGRKHGAKAGRRKGGGRGGRSK